MYVCGCVCVWSSGNSVWCPAGIAGWSDGRGEKWMSDDAVMMAKPAMRMITAEMMTRYTGLFSREVSKRCVIGLLFRRSCRWCDVFWRYVQRSGLLVTMMNERMNEFEWVRDDGEWMIEVQEWEFECSERFCWEGCCRDWVTCIDRGSEWDWAT